MKTIKDWRKMISLAPVDWEKEIDKMSSRERDTMRQWLSEVAKRAVMLEGYLDARYGNGCGDQGHEQAMKQANRQGKMVWMKVFGYNAYHDLNV